MARIRGYHYSQSRRGSWGMMTLWLFITVVLMFILQAVCTMAYGAEKRYVGSGACAGCHEDESEKFERHAKKAHSFSSIEKMREGLTQEEITTCYHCHTTGYGKPGGFVDEYRTPELKNAGCEVCHGPGSLHIESEDPEDIIGRGRLTLAICEGCHSSDRVETFDFKPLIHGGAH